MHLAHGLSQVAHGLVPVEHGRELYHHEACLGGELRHERGGIGRAVGNGNGFAPVVVAPRRVEENHRVPGHQRKNILGLSTLHGGMRQGELAEVVRSHAAEVLVALHIKCPAKERGEEREVNAEAAGEVGKGGLAAGYARAVEQTGHKGGLVACRRFGGALFHGDAGRIDYAVDGSP